jgi:hypothetical protein
VIAGWFEDLEKEVCACFEHGNLTPEQLGTRLGVSAATAVSFILLLASEGRVSIEQVSLRPTQLGGARACTLSQAA